MPQVLPFFRLGRLPGPSWLQGAALFQVTLGVQDGVLRPRARRYTCFLMLVPQNLRGPAVELP